VHGDAVIRRTLKLDIAFRLNVVALIILLQRRDHRHVRDLISLLASLFILRLCAPDATPGRVRGRRRRRRRRRRTTAQGY
jgi:hypothetical protein